MASEEGDAESAKRLYHWVRHGPRAPGEDGTIAWFFAMLVWWRIWAMMLIVGGGFLVLGHTFGPESLGPFGLGVIVATVAHEVMDIDD